MIIPSDYEDPLRNRMPKKEVRIESNLNKWLKFEVKKNKVLDDTIQFVKPNLRLEYATIDLVSNDFQMREEKKTYCKREEIVSGACKPYISLNYEAGGELFVIRRNYKSISTILGEIGGILKVISTVVLFLYSFYHIRQVKSYLGLKMLGISKEKFEELKKLEKKKFRGKKFNQEGDLIHSSQKKHKVVLEKAIQDILNRRSHFTDLTDKLNELEVIQQAVFEDYERKLIPLVLLQKKLKKIKKKF